MKEDEDEKKDATGESSLGTKNATKCAVFEF